MEDFFTTKSLKLLTWFSNFCGQKANMWKTSFVIKYLLQMFTPSWNWFSNICLIWTYVLKQIPSRSFAKTKTKFWSTYSSMIIVKSKPPFCDIFIAIPKNSCCNNPKYDLQQKNYLPVMISKYMLSRSDIFSGNIQQNVKSINMPSSCG